MEYSEAKEGGGWLRQKEGDCDSHARMPSMMVDTRKINTMDAYMT